jgi:hypothetical protein
MPVLIINDTVRRLANEMVARARAKPIPWSVMRDIAVDDARTLMALADRPADFDRSAARPEHMLISDHYRCAFSVEEQPAGFVRHLSVSVPKPGKVPHIPAVQMLAELFGFSECPPTRGHMWLEEFEPGHQAVNIAELIEPRAEGTA